jgi:hypothetical protein
MVISRYPLLGLALAYTRYHEKRHKQDDLKSMYCEEKAIVSGEHKGKDLYPLDKNRY